MRLIPKTAFPGAVDAVRQKAPTIADIAAQCNVSKATVSRVMHSPQLVKAPTRALVQNALRESGYTYNAAAGDLAVSQAADHLIELGHRRIGLVVVPANDLAKSLGRPVRYPGLEAGDHLPGCSGSGKRRLHRHRQAGGRVLPVMVKALLFGK